MQAWFADDAASGGYLSRLRHWWDRLKVKGPKFGYFPNAMKTHLLTKPEKPEEAREVLKDTSVEISVD